MNKTYEEWLNEIECKAEIWHRDNTIETPLGEFLGMTESEFEWFLSNSREYFYERDKITQEEIDNIFRISLDE